ncbi:hypothetical protein [Pedomonas mirosovicensis]|uniref:hypothetical protein n=1 Tax=Pedomonas mirosovicensis TaxID=2908641 RepID=UPI002166E6F1|nr:hypothetical protein [Pedomonas mirosovicensis]MCH8686481.1 hypothetical protein [Pedomonas mirosovicensis]
MTRIIQSEEVIKPDGVTEDRGELIRVKAGALIAGGALAIGTAFLIIALYLGDTELRAWATGLISLVVGTAIGFVFSNAQRRP